MIGESAWDALGRRIEHVNDVLAGTTRYYYDGVNEIVEDNGSNTRQRYYVHGVSYIDERLMMYSDSLSRPFYYVVDRMNNVRMLIDRAGAIVERYAYDANGRPRIRESCGRGDMNDNTWMDSTDSTRFTSAKNGSIWDPRADLDDDGDVDSADQTLYNAKYPTWNSFFVFPTVAQAFSDVDNPYGFQGRVHFAIDTSGGATDGKLMLVDHRARMNDPVTGRWLTRDSAGYMSNSNLYQAFGSRPMGYMDPSGQYELDIHFYMTYYLCVACGLGPQPRYNGYIDETHDPVFGDDTGFSNAYHIAWADENVDVDARTEPFNSTVARSKYHFRVDYKGGMSDVVENSTISREPILLGVSRNNIMLFGIGLHALQDCYAHAGYGPVWGHLIVGHSPDFPYSDVPKALRMARTTWEWLNRWKKNNGQIDTPCDSESNHVRGCVRSFETVLPTVTQLMHDTGDEFLRSGMWLSATITQFHRSAYFESLGMADPWASQFWSAASSVSATFP